MNVGANSETDYGNHYQYGKGAAQYAATSGDSNYGGTEDPLDSSVDTASQVWGGSWHMPTRAQMEELIANTTYQFVTDYNGSGINGGTFTATNGAVLFIPAAGYWFDGSQNYVGVSGYYWGSSPDGSSNVYRLYFSNGYEVVDYRSREYGYSVRPVVGLEFSGGGGGGDTPSTKTLWIISYGGDGFVFGQFQDGKLLIEGPNEDKMYIADPQGKILGFENYNPEYEPMLKEQFAQYFGEIESVQVLATGHEINYVVPNWAEYKILN